MGDSYRPSRPSYPSYGYAQYGPPPEHYWHPPPPLLPPGPPPGYPPPVYHFGQHGPGDSQSRFAFQTNTAAPRYPSDARPPPYGDRYVPGKQFVRNDRYRDQDRRDRARPREPRPRVPTADRPLLKFQRGNTPDQLPGMNGEAKAAQRFRDLSEMSDSEEEAMIESDTEIDGTKALDPGVAAPENVPASESVGQNATQWSNPELYTALPPTHDTSRKKKDVVKMIRRARVSAQQADSLKQVAQNDDFISFDLRDEEQVTTHDDEKLADVRQPPPNAPTGPRASLQTPDQQPLQRPAADNNSHAMISSVAQLLQEDRKRKHSPESGDEDHDDQRSVEAPPIKRAKMMTMNEATKKAEGHILDQWKSEGIVNPIPWVKQGQHNFTEIAGFRLHKEICDFFEFVKPRDFEELARQDLLQRTRNVMRRFNKDCDVQCFGSFAAGLYLPDADMDLVALTQTFLRSFRPSMASSFRHLQEIGNWLLREGLAQSGSIEVISSAKVPLVKFVDSLTGLRVDLSFENITGVLANTTYDNWKAQYPAMPIIVTIIKQFLLMRGLNEVRNGGIGGFTVACLVTSLLQNMPRVQTGDFNPEQHLGEVLLEFLDFYGNQFDLARVAIRLNPPALLPKSMVNPHNWATRQDRLHITDPNNLDNDISGGSKNVELIFEKFARAREEILAAMQSPSAESYLGPILAGNYSLYLTPRDRLRKLSHRLGKSNSSPREGSALYALFETTPVVEKLIKAGTKKKRTAKEKNEARAKNFRRRFPDFPKLYNELTKKEYACLVEAATQQPGGVAETIDKGKKTTPTVVEKRGPPKPQNGQQTREEDRKSGKSGQDLPKPNSMKTAQKATKKTTKQSPQSRKQSYAADLRKQYPEFASLIPPSIKKSKASIIEKLLKIKKTHPELQIPKDAPIHQLNIVLQSHKHTTSSDPRKVKKRRVDEIESTQSHNNTQTTDLQDPSYVGRLQGQQAGSGSRYLGPTLVQHGQTADDPVVLD